MRVGIKNPLILAGLTALFAVIAVGSAAGELTIGFENVECPEWAYDSETITVSFDLVLTDATWEDVEAAGVMWSDTYLDEFANYTTWPYEAHVDGNSENQYTVSFGPIGSPDTIYLYTFCNIDGWWGSWYELHVIMEIIESPTVSFGSTMGWNVAEEMHHLYWSIQNAGPTEIEATSIYWDTVSHAGGEIDKADYPNQSEVFSLVLYDSYNLNITLPDEPGTVFFIVHAQINGRDFYDPVQRGISVVGRPTFDVTAPSAVFTEETVTIEWSIPDTEPAYIVETSVFWDTESHGEPIDKAAYAFQSDVLPPDDSRNYGVTIDLPDTSGTVYYVIHCLIKTYGQDYYSDGELTIGVRGEPTITLVEFKSPAFEGSDVNFVWTVDAPAEDMEETRILWDTTDHYPDNDPSLYPNKSIWMIGEDDGTYDVTMEVPYKPDGFYFIIHAKVLGRDFYTVIEESIYIVEIPGLRLVNPPEDAFVGETIEFYLEPSYSLDPLSHEISIRWDSMSHEGTQDLSVYGRSSEIIEEDSGGWYLINITMPASPVTIYLVPALNAFGTDVFNGTEVVIRVLARPDVLDVDTPDGVDVEKLVVITFTLEDDEDVTDVEALWDTSSHPDDMDYPFRSPAVDEGNGTWTVTFKAPEEKGEVHYVLHVKSPAGDVYTTESIIKVEEAEDSPGFGMVFGVVAMAVIAAMIVATRRRL